MSQGGCYETQFIGVLAHELNVRIKITKNCYKYVFLQLRWTAHHPGQCEFGKFLNQGKCGCRRCKLFGQQSEHSYHYYYGDNRFHCRYPWESRDVEVEQENFYDLDNETRTSVRKRLSSDKGFTGTSLLHKYLYPLYGFDVLQYTVIDIFHTIPLNLCKNQVQ